MDGMRSVSSGSVTSLVHICVCARNYSSTSESKTSRSCNEKETNVRAEVKTIIVLGSHVKCPRAESTTSRLQDSARFRGTPHVTKPKDRSRN
jgi:hypothetical protein